MKHEGNRGRKSSRGEALYHAMSGIDDKFLLAADDAEREKIIEKDCRSKTRIRLSRSHRNTLLLIIDILNVLEQKGEQD